MILMKLELTSEMTNHLITAEHRDNVSPVTQKQLSVLLAHWCNELAANITLALLFRLCLGALHLKAELVLRASLLFSGYFQVLLLFFGHRPNQQSIVIFC